jgi:Flp pilus assembly protein TadB
MTGDGQKADVEPGQRDSSLNRLVAGLAYVPGLAAFSVAYFYSVGAIAKIAELRGAGFNPADTLPLTPISQLLALGVSTISWLLVVLIIVVGALMLAAVYAEQRVEQFSAELADLERQEQKQEQAVQEIPTNVDQQSQSRELVTVPGPTPQTARTEDGPKAVDDLTPDQMLSEADRLEASLRRASAEVDTSVAEADMERTETEVSRLDDLVQQAAARVAAEPHGLWGNVRHPVQARHRRHAERDLAHAREQQAETRRLFEAHKTQVAERRAEIDSGLATLAEIKQFATQRRRQERKARAFRRAAVAVMVVSLIAGVLLAPPVESVSYVVLGVYSLLVFSRVRQAPGRQVSGFSRPTIQVAVAVAAVTAGIALQQFVSPGRLPRVVVQAASGSVSGFLVAQTDMQTTVGLPDCRIEAIPSTETKTVIARPRPRRYGKSLGTLLIDWVEGTKTKPARQPPAKCGG